MTQQARLSATAPIIHVRDLTRTYRFHTQGSGLVESLKSLFNRTYEERVAVDRVSFDIAPGEIVGFLGPNGAGKTTTLKMLSGLLHPTSGEVRVLGFEPFKRENAYLRHISLVMGQKSMLWWDVSAMDTFLLHKEMYDLADTAFRQEVDDLAEMLDVRDLMQVQVRKLSLGERMKMELMAALIHRPDVLFLDEPTIGLDVIAKARVREFLRTINDTRATTIIITSHDMDDIEALCNRVILINHGKIGYDGGLVDLVNSIKPTKQVRAIFADSISPDALPDAIYTDDGQTLTLDVARDRLNDVLATLPTLGALQDVQITDPDVTEIIRDVFQREREVTS